MYLELERRVRKGGTSLHEMLRGRSGLPQRNVLHRMGARMTQAESQNTARSSRETRPSDLKKQN